jgi:hypothetical protein
MVVEKVEFSEWKQRTTRKLNKLKYYILIAFSLPSLCHHKDVFF